MNYETEESRIQMKLPSGESAKSGEAEHAEPVPAANGINNAPAPGGPDFSEFLWMEHQEEFDEEVLRELEEEEMINYYFDLYEDSLEAEASGRDYPYASAFGAPATNPGPPMGRHYGEHPGHAAGDDLSTTLNRVLSFPSRLNPNAAEFVPRQLVVEPQEKSGNSS